MCVTLKQLIEDNGPTPCSFVLPSLKLCVQIGLTQSEAAKMRAKGVRYVPATTLTAAIHAREEAAAAAAATRASTSASSASSASSLEEEDRGRPSAHGNKRPASSSSSSSAMAEEDDGVGFAAAPDRNGRSRNSGSRQHQRDASVAAVLAELGAGAAEEGGRGGGMGDRYTEEALQGEDDDDDAMEEEDEEEEGASSRRRRGAKRASDSATRPTRFMPTPEAAAHLELLWRRESQLLRRLFMPRSQGRGYYKPGSRDSASQSSFAPEVGFKSPSGPKPVWDGWRSFFLRMLPVPPARFRPPARMGEMQMEHPQVSR